MNRYQYALYHHGIKGMKWGVRRFQKKDGSLTSAGKKRYRDDTLSKKSKHREKLEQKYKNQGMNSKDAEIAAAKQIKAEKVIAAVAGVTVAACAAYCVYNNISDKTLKSSTEFQRIMELPIGGQIYAGRAYVAYDKRDLAKYKGILGKTFFDRGTVHPAQVVKMKYNRDLKVASPKRAKDTFTKLFNENSDFRSAFIQSANEMTVGQSTGDKQGKVLIDVANKLNASKIDKINLRTKGYDAFNIGLANNSPSGKKAAEIFYKELRKQGIDAIEDINDKKYSGYRSKHPLILFNGSYDWEASVLLRDQMQSNFNKAYKSIKRENAIEKGAKFVAYASGVGIGGYGISSLASRQAITNYRLEHPGTNLTDLQIINTIYK